MVRRFGASLLRHYRQVSLTWRFGIAAFVVVVVVGSALTRLTDRVIANNAQNEGELDVADQVSRLISTRLTPADLEAPMSGDRREAFDPFVRSDVLSARIARVKL
ncbi:MAG: hypothetical protein HY873_08120, partial [Chloroflexi bacterium]|nr:hypothetical protein [Chloroflexota bacterium]